MKRLLAVTAMAAASGFANAELMNISATGMQTGTQDAVACTIIDDGTTLLSGGVLLFVFAEGSGDSDPDLRVWSLDRNYSAKNNNWGDGVDLSFNGQTTHINLRDADPNGGLVYPTLLRSPARAKDAAAFILVNRLERICAQSLDRSGTGKSQPVSISITDINALTFKSQPLKSGEQAAPPNGRMVQLERLAAGIREKLGD